MQKLSILAICAALAACGGGGSSAPEQSVPPPVSAPTVTLAAPVTQVLAGGKPVTVSATVSPTDSVSWQLAAGAPGSITANGASVQYTPPATVSTNTPVSLTAKSGSTSRTVILTVYPDPGAAGLSLIAGTMADAALIDGPADTARFGGISDMTPALGGGWLVADHFDNGYKQFNALRKIGADQSVNTLLRTVPGHADGDLSKALLGTIVSVAQTSNGTIWFTDNFAGRNYVRRLTNGFVSTLLDQSSDGLGGFRQVYSALASTLYLTTSTSVWQMSVSGAPPTLLAGDSGTPGQSPQDGTGVAVRFSQLQDIAITPSGDLVVADGCLVRNVTAGGVVSTIAGDASQCTQSVDGPAASVRFQSVNSIAVNAAGDIFIKDLGKVRKLAAGAVNTVYTIPSNAGQSTSPQFLISKLRASAAGDVLAVRTAEVDKVVGSQLQRYAGFASVGEADVIGIAYQLATDLAGNIYQVDEIQGFDGYINVHNGLRVHKIASDGTLTTLYSPDSSFQRPAGIAAGPDGTLYVVEQASETRMNTVNGGAVYKLGADGKLVLLAGQRPGSSVPEQVDGQGAAARFIQPRMAGADRDGNIYINDGDKLRKVTSDGMVTTVTALPADLGRAPDGFLYKVDQARSRVVRVNADGSETTVAGGAEVPGLVLGPLPGGLNQPLAIVPTAPFSFAIGSVGKILKLVLPH